MPLDSPEFVVWEDRILKAEREFNNREFGFDFIDKQDRKFMEFYLDREVIPEETTMDRQAVHQWAEENGTGFEAFTRRIMTKETHVS